MNGHYRVVDLLKESANSNLQDHNGLTALMFASLDIDGHYQVVKFLLKENADPNLQT